MIENKKITKREVFVLLTVIFILFLLFSHPFIHTRYFFEKVLNSNKSNFFIAEFEIQYYSNDNYDFDYLDESDYFSKSLKKAESLEKIDVSKFDNEDSIFIKAGFTNNIHKAKVFINGVKIRSELDTDYDLFDKYYISKTVRTWIHKSDLILNDVNKIDFHIKDNVYTYYFYVIDKK